MKTNTHDCDPQRIDAYLDSDRVEPEDAGLAEHLERCESCRAYLESRAGDAETWAHAATLLCPSEFDNASTVEFSSAFANTLKVEQSAVIRQVLQLLAPTDDPHRLGRIGEYEVTGVVGAGGMGVVLKAVDPALDRVVAIKVMAPQLANQDSARRRFEREAKAAAAVLHPNVIPIHCVCGTGPMPYLVMAYIRGGSLQKRLDREGALPTIDILRIASQIAAGLAAAHEQGLVHRDIKPENILLEEGVERVTLTDFGLARAVDDVSITHVGTITGTPRYMSPEQARGEAIDQQSDLFSLGSVMYALCTGQPPFRADTSIGVMRSISDTTPTPIREINPDIPDWLTHIVDKLMSKDKAGRFATADQVRRLLEICLSHTQQPTHNDLPASLRKSLAAAGKQRGLRAIVTSKPGVFSMLALTTAAMLAIALPSINDNDRANDTTQTPPQHAMLGAPAGLPIDPREPALIEKKTAEFLDEAARNGDLQAVQAALKAGVNPNGQRGQATPLMLAVSKRITTAGDTAEPSIEIAKALIDAGADVNAKDYLNQTALEWAATHASPEIVQLLIKAGANVNTESSYGTPLGATSNPDIAKLLIDAGADVNAGKVISPLANAVKSNNTKLVELLIKSGAEVNDPKHTPLLWSHSPEVMLALIAGGAKTDLTNAQGDTFLHLPYAGAVVPDAETIRLVLADGLDINKTNKAGSTPLHAAAMWCLPEIIEQYIAAGAKLDIKDQQGNTPLSLASARLEWAKGNQYIEKAPYEKSVDMLVKAGAKDSGRTPLQDAVIAGDAEQVKKLIAAKADVNEPGPQKMTALHYASKEGHAAIVKLLLQAGAKHNAENEGRMKPLHLAANAESAQALIDAGATVSSPRLKADDPAQFMQMPGPLFTATIDGKADVVKVLLKHADTEKEARGGLLNWAVLAGQAEVVKVLLADKQSRNFLNPQNQFFQPLHVAASATMGVQIGNDEPSLESRLAIAKLLIESGAPVDSRWGANSEMDPDSPAAGMVGTTPLMFAADKGEVQMLRLLLDKGADPKATNDAGLTALYFAAERGHLEVVEELVKQKVDVNARTKSGQTPLDVTTSAEVKVYLIQQGAKQSDEQR